MIKRQFYRADHADNNDDGSDDSSSSSEDDSQPHEEEEEEAEAAAEAPVESSPESGYQSEDGSDGGCELNFAEESGYQSEDGSESGEELNAAEAWPGKLKSDDIEESESLQDRLKQNRSIDLVKDRVNRATESAQGKHSNQWAEAVDETERDRGLDDLDDCVIQCKSVFRCKLCPRIVCLSVDSINMHLDSKRHARSQKLFAEGRLKLMLNSDGELEEEAETHAERHARIVASVELAKNSRKRNRGRQRQKHRKKKKTSDIGNGKAKVKHSSEVCKKKRNIAKDEHHKGI